MDKKIQHRSLDELKAYAEQKAGEAAEKQEIAAIAQKRLKELLTNDAVKLTFQKELISSLTKVVEMGIRSQDKAEKALRAYQFARDNFGAVDITTVNPDA
ncbi:MAG: hypothetical protein II875_09545 [Clostridia bacterium]|nr:hypothetical protein [Clostridia bacterium]